MAGPGSHPVRSPSAQRVRRQSLLAIARRFEISLRQAEKYALVWRVFFQPQESEKNVHIDEILLDEPSWYVVAATETNNPNGWLAYAQDRKQEDVRYSVAAFRRDIQLAKLRQQEARLREVRGQSPLAASASRDRWGCPWVALYCNRSGRPAALESCKGCETEARPKAPWMAVLIRCQGMT